MSPSLGCGARPITREPGEMVAIHPMTEASSRRGDALLRRLVGVPRLLVILLLRFYQRVISPLSGPSCRFYPSCSQYAMLAVERHGALKGSGLALWRVLRCNPWNPGGVDDVPSRGGRLESGACDHEPSAGTTTTDRREGL